MKSVTGLPSEGTFTLHKGARRKWKPELRILGIEAVTTCGSRQLCVCVVSRGPLLIDGSFTLWWSVNDATSLAQGIKSSQFYKELAAVVVSNSLPLEGRTSEVASILSKPVLLATGPDGKVIECSGMGLGEAVYLLKVFQGPQGVEALRIASLLAPLARALYEAWKNLNQPHKGEEGTMVYLND